MKALGISERLIVCHNQLGCQSGERSSAFFFCKKRFDEIFALLVYYFYVTKLMFFCASKRMHILQSEPLIIVKKTFCYYDKRMLKWKYIMDNFLLKGFELYKNEDIFSLGNLQIRSMIH